VTPRERLAQALRDEFTLTEPAQLDPFAAGVAAALSRRGITSVPGANPPAKPWNRTVIDTLLADKQAAEQAAARKAADQAAPPQAPTVSELVKRALMVQVAKITEPEDTGSGTPALNSSSLLDQARGRGNDGSINGSQW
jgi:hypothetical protein